MTKPSFIYLALIFSLALTSFAKDCKNPLLGLFNIPGLNASQSGSNLPYCANLQAGETCCSADVVSQFQNRTNTLVDTVNNYAAGRDLYLAQLNNRYLPSFNSMLQDINNNHQDDLQNILGLNATVGNTVQAIINNATQVSQSAQNINSQFASNLSNYQKLRTTCFDVALEVQSSAWCLACDPNYATEGVASNGVITYSDGLCQAISDACYPYLNQNGAFNPLITVRQWYWRLFSVTNYLKNYTTNGALNPFTIAQDPYAPLDSQNGVVVPPVWTGNGNNTGPAQCQDLWAGDSQLAFILNFGAGSASIGDDGNNTSSRLLQDVVGSDGTWAPDLTGTGLDFGALRTDPGDYFNVAPDSSNS